MIASEYNFLFFIFCSTREHFSEVVKANPEITMFQRKSFCSQRSYFLPKKFALALVSVKRPLRSGFLEAWTEAVFDVDPSLPVIRGHVAGQPPVNQSNINQINQSYIKIVLQPMKLPTLRWYGATLYRAPL